MVKMLVKSTGTAFVEALTEIGGRREDVVVLDTDTASLTGTSLFGKQFPDRFFQMGTAEQNMLGVAAGMSTTKKIIPFAVTLTDYISKRGLAHVSLSLAYSRLNVKIVGCLGGAIEDKFAAFSWAVDDLAIMRTVSNITVINPADAVEMEHAVAACVNNEGPVYIRAVYHDTAIIFNESYHFKWCEGAEIKEGNDIAIISTGIMTPVALQAARMLSVEGINARLIHLHTIKPLDSRIIIKAARETKAVVTVENHGTTGGLGGAVSEVIGENEPVLLKRVGINDLCRQPLQLRDIFNNNNEFMKLVVVKAVKDTLRARQ